MTDYTHTAAFPISGQISGRLSRIYVQIKGMRMAGLRFRKIALTKQSQLLPKELRDRTRESRNLSRMNLLCPVCWERGRGGHPFPAISEWPQRAGLYKHTAAKAPLSIPQESSFSYSASAMSGEELDFTSAWIS